MKKLLLMAACIIMMSMTASALTINKAMLVHNGNVTLYDNDKIQYAIYDASDGDAIYLTFGTFKPFNVTKMITIRGVGETSVIDGDVNISIPGSPKLTSPVLEGLAVSGTVSVKAQVDDLIIRQCKIANLSIDVPDDGGVLDRCYITKTLTLSSKVKGMTIVNTKLKTVNAQSGATQNYTFVNCNIYDLYGTNFSGTLINSIIQESFEYISSSVLLNTLLYAGVFINTSSVTHNCYERDGLSLINSSTCECTYSTSQLQSYGYLGMDGTVVGIYGGDTPYTLVPSVPKVTNSDLQLDNKNKQLNVKLTVSPQ